MYHKIEQADLSALEAIAPGRVFAGGQISEDYGHDELGGVAHMPEVLVRVDGTDEVSAVLRYANANRIPVVVRGSGTGLVGASVAVHGGIMLETTGMNRILELDEENLTVTVQPGVLLMELAEYVQERGFFYPPDPGEKSATIGGNISTNAGGMRAVKYGVTRDYVRGLTVVLPTGEIVELGGKLVKNSSGYSLKELIVGSEGTLGVITQAVLKLLPLPSHSVSLLVPFDSMEAALEVVPCIVRAKVSPTAIEYMSRETILFSESYLGKKFPDTHASAYILLTFDGNAAAQVDGELEAVAELCLEHGAQDAYIVDTDERKKSVPGGTHQKTDVSMAAPGPAGCIDRGGGRAGMAASACACAIGCAGARCQPVCRADTRACRHAGTHRAGGRLRQGRSRPHRAFGQRCGG